VDPKSLWGITAVMVDSGEIKLIERIVEKKVKCAWANTTKGTLGHTLHRANRKGGHKSKVKEGVRVKAACNILHHVHQRHRVV